MTDITFSPIYSDFDLQGNKIRNIGSPIDPGDAFRLVDSTQLRNELLNSIQASQQGLELKISVRVVSNVNVPLSTINPVVDGIQTISGDRVGLIGQTNATQNGIYIVSSSGLVRSPDANTSDKLPPSAAFRVNEGGVFASHLFVLINDSTPVLGTDAIIFQDQTPIIAIAGDGLIYNPNSNAYDIVGTDDRILINPDSIDISPAYDISVNNQITAAIAPINTRVGFLEVNAVDSNDIEFLIQANIAAREQAVTLTNASVIDGTATFSIFHGFNSSDIALLSVRVISTGKTINPGSFNVISNDEIRLSFTSSILPANNTLRALIRKVG